MLLPELTATTCRQRPTYIYSWMLEDRINIGLRIQLRVCRIISGFRQQAPMVGAAELERVARSLWGN
ncbi:hypothetical protein F443_15530 [Phytophthora nicotianae P1569]|uniref:Uncharacterized protein n=1 Tax=Phytophthora nicotianae P1569 TaxID=1317065 RepID=V9EL73_PHYNI|nr:hypothetical protein F443_15530 [Phytophthora nicotianae P1569]